jgi:hypothetical protein
MVEIKIGLLRGECLNRRIGEREILAAEIDAWKRQRNAAGARIKWIFTTALARDKLARCESASKRDAGRKDANVLLSPPNFVRGGVPIGAD